MKIGILGGTFDPIHYGHLLLAETAYDRFHLDKVLIMPAGDPYFKDLDKVGADLHRAEMTQIAISDNPHFEYSDLELKREGNTYTIDTLRTLHEQFPEDELFFIVGSDTLFQIENWNRPEEVFSLATFLTSTRNIDVEKINQQIQYLEEKYSAKIYNVFMPNMEISSTDIRNRIHDGLSVKYFTTDGVIDYIKNNKLYID